MATSSADVAQSSRTSQEALQRVLHGSAVSMKSSEPSANQEKHMFTEARYGRLSNSFLNFVPEDWQQRSDRRRRSIGACQFGKARAGPKGSCGVSAQDSHQGLGIDAATEPFADLKAAASHDAVSRNLASDSKGRQDSASVMPLHTRAPVAAGETVRKECALMQQHLPSQASLRYRASPVSAITRAENLSLPEAAAGDTAQLQKSKQQEAALGVTGPESTPTGATARGDVRAAETDTFTTLFLQNLPEAMSQQDLINALVQDGFARSFNFCYMPASFSTGLSRGYAFINFRTHHAANLLLSDWSGGKRFCDEKTHCKALHVSRSSVQGIEALLAQPSMKKMQRVRNPLFRPYIARDARGLKA